MLKIELHNLWFHAHHGLYEEEKVLGGNFNMDITLFYQPRGIPNQISDTVDYSAVYALVKNRMTKPEPLLETLVMNICNEILEKFSIAEEITVSIKKTTPPIIGFTGSVSVTYTTNRKAGI
ncbi:MAG TPA: dihydroneopterin aldolase [Arachidicoccus soli]|uniref:7,8-dihydroneopterin aldolase n=1 Tax=Arachidicoccus soli TaxID=2341117 RepID=A0A386HP62_9BACT|nr:dihydroneopterin aldolase [Arachidicoccus soli]AYD47280.1 dihydroneopterin aldolase [Arachidicoccus soli]HEU0226321.1 dihydroneopterin aldolase [Arachidicoccus soli]